MTTNGNMKENLPEMSEESDGSDNDDYDDEHSASSEDSQEDNPDDEQPVWTRGPNKGADVPENEEDRPTIIASGNQFPDTRVTSDITQIIRSNYNGCWPTWRSVPQEIKDLMFKQFSMHFKWPAWRHTQIYKTWKHTNSDRFQNMMSDERKKAENQYGANKIEWKKYKSPWIHKRHWVRLIDKVWNTKKWEDKSESSKYNRSNLLWWLNPYVCVQGKNGKL